MSLDIEKIVREYIDKSIHMSLATASEAGPWVCEVHFVYDQDLNLYFRSLQSRRHSQEIASSPNVAGNIVKQHLLEEYPHGIYFEGQAELLTNEAERQKVFPLFKARLNSGEGIMEEAADPEGHQFYKVTVKNWAAFGKFGEPTGGKYELAWNGDKK